VQSGILECCIHFCEPAYASVSAGKPHAVCRITRGWADRGKLDLKTPRIGRKRRPTIGMIRRTNGSRLAHASTLLLGGVRNIPMMVTAMPLLSCLFQQRSAHPTSFEPRLEVRSGLHRGACIRLSNRSYSVGSAVEADIVLRDSDIESRHALLHLEGPRIKVEACDGNVGVGSRVLAEGYACYLQLPAELALGNVNLRVVAAPRPPAVGIVARAGTPMMKFMTGGRTALLVVVSLQVLVFSLAVLVVGTFPALTKSSASPLFVRRGSYECSAVARRRAGPRSPPASHPEYGVDRG
jgi:Inner membrane component of T3SS, cytoplasmic domain